PEREAIAKRYLKYQRGLVREALERLTVEETPNLEEYETAAEAEEAEVERPLSLNAQRIGAVMAVLRSDGAKRVVDLGCGEGQLLKSLLADPMFEQIVGLDVSSRAMEIAAERLHMDRLPEKMRERIRLLHGALTYRDARLTGFDAATVIEVIEH